MQDVFMPVTIHQWDKSKQRPSVEAACPGNAPRGVKIRWLHGVYPPTLLSLTLLFDLARTLNVIMPHL